VEAYFRFRGSPGEVRFRAPRSPRVEANWSRPREEFVVDFERLLAVVIRSRSFLASDHNLSRIGAAAIRRGLYPIENYLH
jgi:hypothetical protein